MDVDVDATLCVDDVAAVVKLLDTAVYDLMRDPPSEVGGVYATEADLSPGVATTLVGAPGTVTGMTAALAADFSPLPTALVAYTTKAYGLPFVRLDT